MKRKDPLKYFTLRINYWVEFFGLHNWDVNVHADDDTDEETLAETYSNVNNKRADIYLIMDWGDTEMTQSELDKTAFHEVLEVMLAEIRYIAGKRDIRFGEIDSAIHSIIRILTVKIFKGEKR
ncbi:MAG: hypothetical protein IMF01_07070 [Proteobacteria bacterium]|nr:hypothetical protein [Pseudomonadota bacterium]